MRNTSTQTFRRGQNGRWLVIGLCSLLLAACDRSAEPASQNQPHNYNNTTVAADCASPLSSPEPGRWNDLSFEDGLRYNLRAPLNYRAQVKHPLIVVFAAATHSAAKTEQFTGLTPAATERGYLIAYLNSRRLSTRHLTRLNGIVDAINQHWCVDLERVFFTGHSDGGTTAVAQTFLPELKRRPRAIAPSAAGFSAEALREIDCDTPTPSLILGLRDDELFPKFARALFDWQTQCNQCRGATKRIDEHCVESSACSAPTMYCEVPGTHRQWPQKNAAILSFFDQFDRQL